MSVLRRIINNMMIFHDLIQILFPSPCLLCGYLGDLICKDCFSVIEFKPHLRKIGPLEVCSAMYYENNSLLESLIHAFKYSHQKDAYRFFVPFLSQSLKLLRNPEKILLVPVPLHKNRENERGYNQSEVMANYIGRRNGIAVVNILERFRNTLPQAQIESRRDRKENIGGAFRVRDIVSRECFKEMHLVLVDDIVTSGSTLLECRHVLKEAGYGEISALTLADREYSKNRRFSQHDRKTNRGGKI